MKKLVSILMVLLLAAQVFAVVIQPRDGGGNDANSELLIGGTTTTFTDESRGGANHAVTGEGDPTWGATQTLFGQNTIELDANDNLTIASSSDWAMGTGDFTFDCWVYYDNAYNEGQAGWLIGADDANNFDLYLTRTAGVDRAVVFLENVLIFNIPFDHENAIWQHVALVRDNSALRIYLNGIQIGTEQANATNVAAHKLNIGKQFNDTGYIDGFLANWRLTKGFARYKKNFTPMQQAYE